jgi:hypothetical protein
MSKNPPPISGHLRLKYSARSDHTTDLGRGNSQQNRRIDVHSSPSPDGGESRSADANGNGVVDAADYVHWRNHQAEVPDAMSLPQTAIPEPRAIELWLLAIAVQLAFGRKRLGL